MRHKHTLALTLNRAGGGVKGSFYCYSNVRSFQCVQRMAPVKTGRGQVGGLGEVTRSGTHMCHLFCEIKFS